MPLPTFTLTGQFTPGTTGKVVLVNPFVLLDTNGDEIETPFEQEITLDGSAAFSEEVVSGEDPDVTPNPWPYTVYFRLDGQVEQKFSAVMPFADADLVDILNIGQPVTPEWFVLKSEFLNALDAINNPVSEADVETLIGVHDADPAAHPDIDRVPDPSAAPDGKVVKVSGGAYVLGDDLTAEAGSGLDETAADLLYRRLDTEVPDADVAATIARDSEVTSAVGTETTNRIADVDAEETRALTAEGLLAPKASPAFTGNPTAPTPSPGDNDTSVATTAFVTDAVGSETTARISDVNAEETARIADVDAEETRALTAEGLLAPKASPALTGNPTAPTASPGDNDTTIATTAFTTAAVAAEATARVADVDAEETRALTAEALLAPKASPAFTGNPTVPNQTAGDNDTSAANTAFVTGAVATETTARIADVDAEETRALTAEALLAPKASPTFTGNPVAPTPSQGDNDTSIATTAFVQTELGLYIPKSLAAAKGDIIAATGNDVFAIHTATADGTFLTYKAANSDGLEGRLLAYTDLPTLPRWQITMSAQTITTGTGGAILNTSPSEVLDTHGFHSTVSNQERITIPTGLGGTYLVMPKVSWQTTAGAAGFRRINIDLNLGATTETVYIVFPASNTAINFGCTLIMDLAAGDILRLEGVHTQGANLQATVSNWSGVRIGP